jgi:signal transduction histidine kinase
MLETLAPGNRPAAASDDERAFAERRAGGAGEAAAPWSGNWLQLSHELRTPLNAILGNIELLLDGSAGPLAAPVRACVGDIQIASRQLLRQLQPLLLLVQARTAGAPAAGLPIDLLALLRQVAAEPAAGAPGQRHGCAPHLPEGACLMVPGDPIWLGVLVAALVDLHAASAQAGGSLAIALEQPRRTAAGVVLRASWPGLDPAALSPLPLALIDAVLALHGGRIRSLSADGVRLDLPNATVLPSDRSGRDRR